MKVQVLMASMNLKLQEDLPSGLNDLKEDNIRCTIVNQCPGSMPDFVSNQENVDLFSIDEKGLSKSRNRNLNLLTEKINSLNAPNNHNL